MVLTLLSEIHMGKGTYMGTFHWSSGIKGLGYAYLSRKEIHGKKENSMVLNKLSDNYPFSLRRCTCIETSKHIWIYHPEMAIM